MRMITAREAEEQFGQFIASVSLEPVTVVKDGTPAACRIQAWSAAALLCVVG